MAAEDLVSVGVARLDSRARVTVAGELDVATAAELRNALSPLIDGGVSLIAVDLAKVEFIDSTGIGVLVGAMKRMQNRGGAIVVEAASPGVRRVLEMTGVLGALGA